ncbi:MAG: hypothetical protein ACE5HE_05450 [Phycisphaerae bacterium]
MQHLTRVMVLGALGVGMVGLSAVRADDARAPTNLQVPRGAGVTAATLRSSGRPTEVFPVHVYLSNIPDLGAYQIRLKAEGGTRGSLSVRDLTIERSRKDYVFGTEEIVDVVNRTDAILGAVKARGGTAVGKPRYAGTFNFEASADAKGVFSIVIEKGPAATLLTNSVAQTLPFELGQIATITVSGAPKRPVSGR